MREMSKKNIYYLPKNRVKELEYFCKQYYIWQDAANHLLDLSGNKFGIEKVKKSGILDPVERIAESREHYLSKMDMIHHALDCTFIEENNSQELKVCLFKNVTMGATYESLCIHSNECALLPRNEFFKYRQMFFFYLSKFRD